MAPISLTTLTTRSFTSLAKRTRSTGATAGLAIGIVVAALLILLICIFLIIHFRRAAHLKKLNNERAILAGEKNPDGTDKIDKFAPQPSTQQQKDMQTPATAAMGQSGGGIGVRRNKSVKDRLMGPMYRGSTIELPPMKIPNDQGDRGSRVTLSSEDGGSSPLVHSKPWAESSPRPSFSSKRATRMMMMM